MADHTDTTMTGEVGRRRRVSPERTLPQTYGRYTIASRLGSGGMGVVYEAHDAELDRSVALKLLHPSTAPNRSARLLREAKTLARLSHPNIVPVFDIGSRDGELFLAMELVPGQTLAEWVASTKPTLAQALSLLLEAGRGLAHAHQNGLLHGDFKPVNVLVGADGRARVADFGLARPIRPASPPQSAAGSPTSSTTDDTSGTPAYMAPEQLSGHAFDERSDQFSYCLSAWEVLFGVRPKRGERGEAILGPGPRSVPRYIRNALEQGLAERPEHRHATMSALLQRLERDPWRPWRRGALAVVALAGVGGLAYAQGQGPAPCTGLDAPLRAAWNEPASEAILAAFTATGVVNAEETHTRVAASFDAYGDGWSQMRTAACRATRIEQTQSDQLLDLRMRCLDDRLGSMEALIEVLKAAEGGDVVQDAARSAGQLPALTACEDADALAAVAPLPDDPELLARVEEISQDVWRAMALERTGQYATGLVVAEAAVVAAASLENTPVLGKAQLVLGKLRRSSGDAAGAAPVLREATKAAARVKDDETAVEAWLELVWITAASPEKFEEFTSLADVAEALVTRTARGRIMQAHLLQSRARMAGARGEFESAVEFERRGLELIEDHPAPSPYELAAALTNLGLSLRDAGKYDEARTQLGRAAAVGESGVGPQHPSNATHWLNMSLLEPPDEREALQRKALALVRSALRTGHPETATMLANLGLTLANGGKYEEAVPMLEEALAVQREVYPDGHATTSNVLFILAQTLNDIGRRDEASRYAEELLSLRKRLLQPDHPETARAVALVGTIALDRGDTETALARYEEALEVFERTLPPDHPRLGMALGQVGLAANKLGQPLRTLEVCGQALALSEKALGEDDPFVVPDLMCLAGAHEKLGRFDEALARLERALELWTRSEPSPLRLATLKLQLAAVLEKAHKDRPRALALARDAAATLEQFPDASPGALTRARALVERL